MKNIGQPVGPIAVDDLMIPSDTPGIELHLRRKRLPAKGPFPAEHTVVLVHGATYSSGSLFDVRLGGLSFMDHLALEGFDVYGLDVRGYGGSTRPPEMDEPPGNHPPVGRTETGVRDLASAIDFVRTSNGVDRVNLVAMSWGGSVAGAYASRNYDTIVRLALVAPQWLREGPSTIDVGGDLEAYRHVVVADMKARWLSAAPEDKRESLIPSGWFEAWANASLATDPLSASTATMRAVNGPVLDSRVYWSAGRPFYDPGAITVPVLLVHAEWDVDVPINVARAYFAALLRARYRRWIEIGEGTHMVLLEKNRMQAFQAISIFLREDDPLVV
jgi:pimeloyl-ACP methyl ester carboxylesterase